MIKQKVTLCCRGIYFIIKDAGKPKRHTCVFGILDFVSPADYLPASSSAACAVRATSMRSTIPSS